MYDSNNLPMSELAARQEMNGPETETVPCRAEPAGCKAQVDGVDDVYCLQCQDIAAIHMRRIDRLRAGLEEAIAPLVRTSYRNEIERVMRQAEIDVPGFSAGWLE